MVFKGSECNIVIKKKDIVSLDHSESVICKHANKGNLRKLLEIFNRKCLCDKSDNEKYM